jgi:hypothetical protein
MSSALFIPCPARRFDARILGMSVLIVSFANFARSCFRRGRRAGDIEGVSISNVRLHRKIRIVLPYCKSKARIINGRIEDREISPPCQLGHHMIRHQNGDIWN